MAVYGSRWSRDETLLAFSLYCELPFGQLHQRNPEIISLAQTIGRTPSSVAMKACNFASLDPAQRKRGIKGLTNASKTEQEIWDAFLQNSAELVDEITIALTKQDNNSSQPSEIGQPLGPSETTATINVRRHQRFFRAAVLTTYGTQCALTGLNLPELLVASHIVPWSKSPERRCDPTNGLCLNALHDRAFDCGLFTFDETLHLIPSDTLLLECELGLLRDTLPLVGKQLHLPQRFHPCQDALQYHRECVFKG